MVNLRKQNIKKKRTGKGFKGINVEARKINASTQFDTCTERLSPFGGLLALIKFFDWVHFRGIFDSAYQAPSREPKLGHYFMMAGILMLPRQTYGGQVFIGFN